MLRNDGTIFSSSVKEENSKKSPLSFGAGDIVSVELDPTTGVITYSKNGVTATQNSNIRNGQTEPIHFCARLYDKTEISIV